ncbi:MAG: gamma-butyrobetaine dioxygenase [Halopseudomonas aestusnigri]
MTLETANILEGGKALSVQWKNGQTARFHAMWLRDNALDSETRAAGNGQRLITILDIPAETILKSVEVNDNGDLVLSFIPENKEVVFPSNWLSDHSYDNAKENTKGWIGDRIKTWGSDLNNSIPTIEYAQAQRKDQEFGSWLSDVEQYGFAVMTGLPTTSGTLIDVAELFGHVRETNYGKFFEVRSEINPVNLAYTGLGLQAHTDNPYRDPVPTLQLLACLENSADGGDSIVVDGFKAAEILREESPESFDLLAGYPVRFEYAGTDGVKLRAKRPTIELGPDGEILSIRFNNRSSAPFTDIPYDDMDRFYSAYRKYAEIIERPEMMVSFMMQPGDLFIVDNTRVMHARKGFSGVGTRWLQGCYADKDGLLSTLSYIESLQNLSREAAQ